MASTYNHSSSYNRSYERQVIEGAGGTGTPSVQFMSPPLQTIKSTLSTGLPVGSVIGSGFTPYNVCEFDFYGMMRIGDRIEGTVKERSNGMNSRIEFIDKLTRQTSRSYISCSFRNCSETGSSFITVVLRPFLKDLLFFGIPNAIL